MKNNTFIKSFFIISFIMLFSCTGLFAQSISPEPYSDEEFPQAMLDLRRFEVITLGSMPFVTMDAAIVYNGYKYFSGKADKFNPLATADYSPDEMKSIIITSLCVSAGIGITDYVIRLIKRKNSQRRIIQQSSNIKIEDDPEAVRIALPDEQPEPDEPQALEAVE